MKKILLAAVDLNFAIGYQNDLPWPHGSQRADMKRFKELTLGFPIIMGRKTYDSFPKRPLPGRTNIILTRQPPALSLEDAVRAAEAEGAEKAFIIGGAEVYLQAIPLADELDLTLIWHRFAADAFFPLLDGRQWVKMDDRRFPADHENRYRYSFLKFKRQGT